MVLLTVASSFTIGKQVGCFHLEVSKGYAFITCALRKSAARILEAKKHVIMGRIVEVTEALGKLSKVSIDELSRGHRRLFVGGLDWNCQQEDLYRYFSQFGEVMNSYVIYDPLTGKSKSSPLSSRVWIR